MTRALCLLAAAICLVAAALPLAAQPKLLVNANLDTHLPALPLRSSLFAAAHRFSTAFVDRLGGSFGPQL